MKLRSYIKRPRAVVDAPWKVAALCAAYSWPTGLAGGGAIGIVELGGGWVASDIQAFCTANSLPMPNMTDVSVDGTKNTPTAGDDSPDVEVALDIEVAAAAYFAATGKPATIRVYWAQDIATAVSRAAQDGCAVCSISWGAAESQWSAAEAQAMEAAAQAATAAGMVVFAAAGDNDADDSTTSAQVDCPASCPHVVACGGTLKPQGGVESVWNDDSNPSDPSGEGTGGGYSAVFPAQSWQVGAPAAPAALGRMVPDLAAAADPSTGYEIYCHGTAMVVGGTSAVAPLYAGLFAALGKGLGFVGPKLWANRSAFVDITTGGNGLYKASQGPDPCTGLGVPVGTALAALFVPAAQPAPAPSPAPTSPPTLAAALAAVQAAVASGAPLEDRDQVVATVGAALTPLWPAATT